MPRLRSSFVLALVITTAASARAQSTAETPIHWAYGTYFGTGVYRISGGEEAFILSMRPRWHLRDAVLDEQGRRIVGIDLRFPVAIGAYELDAADIGGTLSADNVGTLSAVPGVEFDVPMSARWAL